MKKFIFLAVGYTKPSKKVMDAWTRWFEDIREHLVDSGNPFRSVMEVTASGVEEQPRDKNAITGYIVIKAKDMAEATELAEGCPVTTSLRIYEAGTM